MRQRGRSNTIERMLDLALSKGTYCLEEYTFYQDCEDGTRERSRIDGVLLAIDHLFLTQKLWKCCKRWTVTTSPCYQGCNLEQAVALVSPIFPSKVPVKADRLQKFFLMSAVRTLHSYNDACSP